MAVHQRCGAKCVLIHILAATSPSSSLPATASFTFSSSGRMLTFLSLPFFLVPVTLAATTSITQNDSTSAPANDTVDMVAAAWYTSWHAENFTLTNVSWGKYTHMTFSFAWVVVLFLSPSGHSCACVLQYHTA